MDYIFTDYMYVDSIYIWIYFVIKEKKTLNTTWTLVPLSNFIVFVISSSQWSFKNITITSPQRELW
jgi:hypothetical protein